MYDSCTSKMLRYCLTNFIPQSADKPSSFRDTRCIHVVHTTIYRFRDKLAVRSIGLLTIML